MMAGIHQPQADRLVLPAAGPGYQPGRVFGRKPAGQGRDQAPGMVLCVAVQRERGQARVFVQRMRSPWLRARCRCLTSRSVSHLTFALVAKTMGFATHVFETQPNAFMKAFSVHDAQHALGPGSQVQ